MPYSSFQSVDPDEIEIATWGARIVWSRMDHEVGGAAPIEAASSVAVRLEVSLMLISVSEVMTGVLTWFRGLLWPFALETARQRISILM